VTSWHPRGVWPGGHVPGRATISPVEAFEFDGRAVRASCAADPAPWPYRGWVNAHLTGHVEDEVARAGSLLAERGVLLAFAHT
jgi:hypothetical protein